MITRNKCSVSTLTDLATEFEAKKTAFVELLKSRESMPPEDFIQSARQLLRDILVVGRQLKQCARTLEDPEHYVKTFATQYGLSVDGL